MDMPAARGPVPVVPGVLFGAAVLAAAVWWFWDPEPVRARPQDWALQDPRNPAYSTDPDDPFPMPPELVGVNLLAQTARGARPQECRLRPLPPERRRPARQGHRPPRLHRLPRRRRRRRATRSTAHVRPRYPQVWPTSANPVRSYTLLNHESPEFIRFVNPGDLRIAHISCGTAGCHPKEVQQNRKSMMTHGCMLWGAALYNNGSVPSSRPRFGESYSMNGAPQRLQTVPAADRGGDRASRASSPYLDPLPRFEVSQPGNVLRIFERGGTVPPEIGIPEPLEEPGRPAHAPQRSAASAPRTAPTRSSSACNKTRLFDPTLNFLGTNDHPGDYRSSGCTACHVVYANDRSPVHSGPYAEVRQPRAELRTPTRRSRKNERGPPDRAQVHHRRSRPASAWSATSTPARTS